MFFTWWLRLFFVLIQTLRKPLVSLDEETTLNLRVWPFDAELLAANHAAYATYFEMGRWGYGAQIHMIPIFAKRVWAVIIGGQAFFYNKPMKRFQKFQVKTQLIAFDEKWLYFKQSIESKGAVIASARVRALIRGTKGIIPTQTILSELGNPKIDLPTGEHWKAFKDLMT